MPVPDSLDHTLRQLRLSGLRASLDARLQEASANALSHAQFLELILQDELHTRDCRKLQRRLKKAAFRDHKTLQEYDFQFNNVDRKTIDNLATCHYLDHAEDLLLLGPPGVGKSHLAQALGRTAIQRGYTCIYRSIFDLARDLETDNPRQRKEFLQADLLIIDDMGMKELARQTGEALLEIIMRRHGLRSTIMTTNRPLDDWGKLLGDTAAASAVLDRLLANATIITIKGKSYRMANRTCNSDEAELPVTQTNP